MIVIACHARVLPQRIDKIIEQCETASEKKQLLKMAKTVEAAIGTEIKPPPMKILARRASETSAGKPASSTSAQNSPKKTAIQRKRMASGAKAYKEAFGESSDESGSDKSSEDKASSAALSRQADDSAADPLPAGRGKIKEAVIMRRPAGATKGKGNCKTAKSPSFGVIKLQEATEKLTSSKKAKELRGLF